MFRHLILPIRNINVKYSSVITSRTMHLLTNKTLVNGKWVSAGDNKEFAVTNPVNGENISNVPDMNASDTQKAIEAAHKAFYSSTWFDTTAKDRSNLLKVSMVEIVIFIHDQFICIFVYKNYTFIVT